LQDSPGDVGTQSRRIALRHFQNIPIYDSPTGPLILVSQGTRIIGQYDAGVQFGKRRILLVWNRLILPNGRSIVLER